MKKWASEMGGFLSVQVIEQVSFLRRIMEEITEGCTGIKLSSREDAEVTIHEPVPEDGLVLIGKFFTKRRVNLESVARVLKTIWKT